MKPIGQGNKITDYEKELIGYRGDPTKCFVCGIRLYDDVAIYQNYIMHAYCIAEAKEKIYNLEKYQIIKIEKMGKIDREIYKINKEISSVNLELEYLSKDFNGLKGKLKHLEGQLEEYRLNLRELEHEK